ncbi:TIR domain-containing protein [Cellulosimicrobium marinum]|uniref:TIR domain-containing protein n=1 Tax=Cellulosimicrobium marinum TaxID=1638992 RepID=UPI001E2FB930|nr:TIR domain-containing protein [Cellulosimicrobium marinum]MCB7138259.1 nucleotide-binding protein [Cellulosimicrobium marinum]
MSSVFRRADRRFLADMVADLTHGQQDTFELGLEYTTDGTRVGRGAELIRRIFDDEPEPDPVILELLNYIYVDSPTAQWRIEGDKYATLKTRVLDPRGVTLGEGGFKLPGVTAAHLPLPARPGTGPTPFAQEAPMFTAAPQRDPSRVFVVHGRDMRPVEVLEQFLIFIGLRAMPWSEARALTGKPSPTTYEIVAAGMAGAGAVIVIFSPDDQARLDPRLAPGEPEERPTGQARQNVILEAGMAFATDPRRTIFVQSERTRPVSDIDGFNWVPLDGSWDRRQDLYSRLRDAGARVEPQPGDLQASLAGPFRIV